MMCFKELMIPFQLCKLSQYADFEYMCICISKTGLVVTSKFRSVEHAHDHVYVAWFLSNIPAVPVNTNYRYVLRTCLMIMHGCIQNYDVMFINAKM